MADLLYINFDKNLYRISAPDISSDSPEIKHSALQASYVGSSNELDPNNIISGSIAGNLEFTGGYIQSSNFVQGSIGWRLHSNGTLYAVNALISGTISASSINIPDTTTASSFHVDTSGNTWWGATTLATSLASVTAAGLIRAIGITSLNIRSATCFETAGRFTNTAGGTGANTFSTSGLQQNTGATATSFCKSTWFTTQTVFAGSPTFSVVLNMASLDAANGGGAAFWGLGVLGMDGSGTTFTSNSFCGFWIQKATPVVNLYAVQNNGDAGGYTVSSILTTLADNDVLDLIVKVNGTSSVDYYWRKNVATLSAATNLATRVPTATSNTAQFSITNVASAYAFNVIAISASYER